MRKVGELWVLFGFRRWELMLWTRLRFWTLLPRRKTYWSGRLVHWQWLAFEVVTDNRKDWLGDMMMMKSVPPQAAVREEREG